MSDCPRISERFSSVARGNVVSFSSFANPDKIFSSVELPALLNNSSVSMIDGISRVDLKARYDANITGGMSPDGGARKRGK